MCEAIFQGILGGVERFTPSPEATGIKAAVNGVSKAIITLLYVFVFLISKSIGELSFYSSGCWDAFHHLIRKVDSVQLAWMYNITSQSWKQRTKISNKKLN